MHYLDSEHNRRAGSLDIQLDACLQTLKMREAGQGEVPICRTNYRHAYWTVAQMVAHHTVNGRNLQPGDLFGSGTLSGRTLDQAAALVELTVGRKQPLQLPNGEMRTYLQDGDAVVLRGWCEKPVQRALALASAGVRFCRQSTRLSLRFCYKAAICENQPWHHGWQQSA